MAQIITLPSAPQTGLGQLGQVIFGGAADYAAEKRRTDEEARLRANQLSDEARRRENQLADVQSARNYSDTRYGIERTDRLKDVEQEKMFAAKTELVRLGYLNPSDVGSEAAVTAAITKLHADGLLQKYEAALKSGDLTYADLAAGDAAKINAGLAKFSTRLAADTTRKEGAIASGGAQAADVQRKMRVLEQRDADLSKQISTFEAEAGRRPSTQEIDIRAAEIAAPMAKVPGSPSNAEILAHRTEAEQSLRQERQERLFVQVQSLKEQVALNRQQQVGLTSQSDALARQGMFAPAEMFKEPAAAAPAPAPAPSTPGVSLEQARQLLQQKYGGAGRGQPTPPPAPTTGPAPAAVPSRPTPNPWAPPVFQTAPAAPTQPPTAAPSTAAQTQTLIAPADASAIPPEVTQAATIIASGHLGPYADTYKAVIRQWLDNGGAGRPYSKETVALRALVGSDSASPATLSEGYKSMRAADQSATEHAKMLAEPPMNDAVSSTPKAAFALPGAVFPGAGRVPWWGAQTASPGF